MMAKQTENLKKGKRTRQLKPKSGSAKKLSKAEKDKLKKEEEARRLQEEEEARIQAENEAEENKERERVESEERRQLENEERKRRKGQLTELEEIWTTLTANLTHADTERRVNAKWDRYMLCDGSPDPTIPGEINTYMNLWKEDRTINDIDSVLRDSKLTLKLIEELDFLIKDTPAGELTPADLSQYKETIGNLQDLLQEKLDLASHDLFRKATDLADPETFNLQKVVSNEVISLCAWGNLSKNPRSKSHEFKEHGFTFDIPRVLTLADCGVRMLYTRFDHLSSLCKTCRPRVRRKEEEDEKVADGEAVTAEEGQEGEEGEKKEGEDGEKPEEEEDLNRETTEDLMATLHEGEPKPEEETEEEVKEAEPLEEDYEIKTPEPLDFEDFDGDEDAVDLRANHVLGGIFHFDLIHLPPQPKVVQSWVMTQVVSPAELEYMEYMADAVAVTPAPPTSANAEKDGEEGEPPAEKEDKKSPPPVTPGGGDESKAKREDRPLMAVVIRLPTDVYFCEEPQVVRWDKEEKQWSLNGFSDPFYNEENRVLSFKTTHFGTLALIQDAHINMPFQSWELRPHTANSAVLTIIAAIVEVEIEIKDGLCCYTAPDDKPELGHLKENWMSAKQLIKALQMGGMNVFPAEDSFKYVSIQNKNSITETRLYQQMALTASSMAFSWSKWNSEINNSDKIVLQAAEHIEDEPLLEEDWSLFLISKKRTTKLKMTEFDSPFSEDHAEGTEFHADLYHMTMELVSEQACNRIRETSDHFSDAVYTLLSATRVLTYA